MVSSVIMIWLLWRYPVKTCIVAGILLVVFLVVARLTRPIVVDGVRK
jgi:hypothetical protein